MDKIQHDPKGPKLWELWYIPYNGYGNYGIFLKMGNAGFCPSTVASKLSEVSSVFGSAAHLETESPELAFRVLGV